MKIKDDRLKNQNGYGQIALPTWKEFTNFVNLHKNELTGCLYRGQRNPEWELKPSLYRLLASITDNNEIIRCSREHLENFKKHTRGRHNIPYNAPNDNDTNWWSVGQHYGLATPLLDWVYSPYVAAFFSFIEQGSKDEQRSNDKRAIYALSLNTINDVIERQGRNRMQHMIETVSPLMHENQRLISQQGLFTYIRTNEHQTIESYLDRFHTTYNDVIEQDELFLLKMTIPRTERNNILSELDLMNINKLTLFPDLNGSAEYCNYLLQQRANPNT